MRPLLAILIAMLPVSAIAQPPAQGQQQLETEAAKRIATLYAQCEDLLKPPKNLAEEMKKPVEVREQSEREMVKALDTLADQMNAEIDAYIARAVLPGYVDAGVVQQSLKRILGTRAYDGPSAFVINVKDTPSLIVAYTLAKGGRMGEGGTSVTVRAYAAAQDSLRLVAATGGDDMDGCADVKLVQLRSPIPGEMWVLLTGLLTGANGHHNYMQVYAYDGVRFRSVWANDDWGDFRVRATDRGFAVDWMHYTVAGGWTPGERADVYYLAEDGVHRVSP